MIVRIADSGLKVRPDPVDVPGMLILLTLLTASYFAAVVWVCRGKRRRPAAVAVAEPVALPADDQPPASAVGWPPGGGAFTAYVEEGFAALDAYLAEGFAA